jgi:hypothetical protein
VDAKRQRRRSAGPTCCCCDEGVTAGKSGAKAGVGSCCAIASNFRFRDRDTVDAAPWSSALAAGAPLDKTMPWSGRDDETQKFQTVTTIDARMGKWTKQGTSGISIASRQGMMHRNANFTRYSTQTRDTIDGDGDVVCTASSRVFNNKGINSSRRGELRPL